MNILIKFICLVHLVGLCEFDLEKNYGKSSSEITAAFVLFEIVQYRKLHFPKQIKAP